MKRYLLAVLLAAACSAAESTPSPTPPDGGSDMDAGRDGATTTGKRALCVDGQSVDGPYPKADYKMAIGKTLPDLTFETATGPMALHDFYEPCAPASRLLVLRVSAAWCGTCRWHAAHTGGIQALDIAPRLVLADVVIADEDNLGARVADIAPWQARVVGAPIRTAIDPEAKLLGINDVPSPLPLYVLVDTRTMEVANYLNDPDPQLLELRLRQELALLDGKPQAPTKLSPKVDDTLYEHHWAMLQDMKLPAAPPPDPSNAKADNAAAAALGKKLFNDSALSPSTISCAGCHNPAKAFTDAVPQSTGVNRVNRNSPSVLFAAHSRWQFWDGRADSLWMQALGPIENVDEMKSNRLYVAHLVVSKYKAEYEAIWGGLPPLSDTSRFPANGKPGDASWQGMTAADQDAATRVFVNVGKSIAAFERTLRAKPNRLDQYIAGDKAALTLEEKQGLFDFFVTGCAQCHYGPRLTDDAFHVLRFPTGRVDGAADRGRVDGVPQLVAAEFNSASKWSDAPTTSRIDALANRTHPLGGFKTPPLRGTADTGPYGHGGMIPDLDQLTTLYGKRGLVDTDTKAVGTIEPWVTRFSDDHHHGIMALLKVMTAEPLP